MHPDGRPGPWYERRALAEATRLQGCRKARTCMLHVETVDLATMAESETKMHAKQIHKSSYAPIASAGSKTPLDRNKA